MEIYIPLLFAFVIGVVTGGYVVYLIKRTVLPAEMDALVSIAVSAITQAQTIYGDSFLTNEQKAAQALDIATRALKDAGVPVNAATVALVIKIAYHTLKPEIKALPKADPKAMP